MCEVTDGGNRRLHCNTYANRQCGFAGTSIRGIMGQHLPGHRAYAGLGSRVQHQWCETDPQIVFLVTDSALSYAMPHPNAPNNPTPVYSAMIAPDGSFRVGLTTGTTTSRVTGKHISSKIDGSVCVHSFSLDRSSRGAL